MNIRLKYVRHLNNNLLSTSKKIKVNLIIFFLKKNFRIKFIVHEPC